MIKVHDTGWENSYFTSANVYMLGCGCGASQYPQFCVEDLDMYQVLPHPYLRCLDGFPGYKLIKKCVLDLEIRSETFVWECIESRIISDYRGITYISQY